MRFQLASTTAISAVAGTLLLVGAAPALAQTADAQVYGLPAQSLSKSLREVSLRSGTSVVAPSGLLEGRSAPALVGRYSAREAVERLIAGAELEVRHVGSGLVLVALQDRQSADAMASRPDGNESEEIIVTGTNLRGAQPTSPVITITKRQIDQSAPSSVEQLMRQVPQNFQGGVNQENFGVTGAGSDITESGAGVNLRGLGQRATLVLVNGRRLAPSGSGSFVDISLIPITAVERVEILTDGASAIYGSDAVGGAVNFILRDRFEGVETVVQAGSATRGDGDQGLLGLTAGTSWATGSAMLSYEFRADDEIVARDVDRTIGLDPAFSIFPRERRHSLFGVARQRVTERLSAEITGTFAQRDTERSYFQGGVPFPIEAVADARSIGVSGSLNYDLGGSWTAELTGAYFRSRTDQNQNQPGGEGLVNIFNTRSAVREIAFKIDGDLFDLPAGAAKLAIGAQTRQEAYRAFFETQVNLPNVKQDRRDVRSLFAEAYVPLFSPANSRPGLERLIVTAAGRYEDYDALGGTFDPKLGILWSPLNGLTFRASYDTSFRAPLLSESLGFYNVFLFPAALLYLDPSQAPAGVAAALLGSNPDIRPERSRTWTAGAEFKPAFAPGLTLNANYYSIRFSDRIAFPTEQIVVVGDPALASIVTLDPSLELVTGIFGGANQLLDFSGPGFTNGGATAADVRLLVDARVNNTAETTTSGFDLGLRYDFVVGENRFSADLNANHIFAFNDRLTSDSAAIRALNTPYRPIDWRVRGGIAWSRGGWSANIFTNYTGDYQDNRTANVRKVDSFTTIDARLAYVFAGQGNGLLAGTRISLNAQNLFDADPPRLASDPGLTRGLGYDPVNATGRGRVVSLQLRKTW